MFALESKVDGINAKISSLAARFENRVRAAAQQVMGKATLHKVQPILVSMPNSLEGTITYAIEVCGSHGIYTCNYEVEVKAGEAKISADALKDLFEASERQSIDLMTKRVARVPAQAPCRQSSRSVGKP